jgi:hypothetical protein
MDFINVSVCINQTTVDGNVADKDSSRYLSFIVYKYNIMTY